jgi:uncharacterized protein (DUF1800 family)
MNPQILRSLFVGVLALAFGFATATAQDTGDKKPRGPSKADLMKYDANGDGALDDGEAAAMKADKEAKQATAKAEKMEQYDANKDGKLSKAEREQMKAEQAQKKAEKAAIADQKKAEKEAKKAEREAKKAEREAKKAEKKRVERFRGHLDDLNGS